MGRSGYSDDVDNDWSLIMYRGAVTSAMRGKRGRAFFTAMVEALDAMPERRLIADELHVAPAPNDMVAWLFADSIRPEVARWHYYDWRAEMPVYREAEGALKLFAATAHCGVCALGALGLHRGLPMAGLDPENAEAVSTTFDIAEALAREVVYENDERWYWDSAARVSREETPEERWSRMRAWAVSHLPAPAPVDAGDQVGG